MPNHVTNILTISGDKKKVEECLRSISGFEESDDGETRKCVMIDFNRIIPMPESLNITSGSQTDLAVAVLKDDTNYFRNMLGYPWVQEKGLDTVEKLKIHLSETLDEKAFEEGRMAIENEKKYGFRDWYGWRIQNWGTKWNAYDQNKLGFGKFQFDTAWSTPANVIRKLSQQYPELTFTVDYADEDLGNNCGSYAFEDGDLVMEFEPESDDALMFACKIKEISFSEIVFDQIGDWDIREMKANKEKIRNALKEAEEEGFDIDLSRILGNKNENLTAVEKAKFLIETAVEVESYKMAKSMSDYCES